MVFSDHGLTSLPSLLVAVLVVVVGHTDPLAANSILGGAFAMHAEHLGCGLDWVLFGSRGGLLWGSALGVAALCHPLDLVRWLDVSSGDHGDQWERAA